MEEVDFATDESGNPVSFPQQCSALKMDGYVMIKGFPCKITEISTSQSGKHGHAKVHLVGFDIFTQKKYEDICPSTQNMDVPYVTRKDYSFLDITDGYLCLMDDVGTTREDLKLPDSEVGKEIEKKFANAEQLMVTVLKATGTEAVVGFKDM